MVTSTFIGTNDFNSSTTPLLGLATDKEYCQAKKCREKFY
jgi:hypothetical protein